MTSPFIIRRWDNALPLQSKCMLLQCYCIQLCSGAATHMQCHCSIYAVALQHVAVTLQQMCSDADPVGVYGIVSCFVKKIL